MGEPEQRRKAKKSYKAESAAVFGVVFEIGYIVAIPLVAFGLLGKKLDASHGTHFFVYIGIAAALLCSGAWFYRRFSQMAASLTKAASHDSQNQESNDQKES